MSSEQSERASPHNDIQKHVRTYVLVFVALAFCTLITVLVSYANLPMAPAVIVALLIASIKAGLVACYFMHLISERGLIYWVLGFTVLFFFILLGLPVITEQSQNLPTV